MPISKRILSGVDVPVLLLAALAAYAAGFAIWSPRALLIVDESRYVSQAVAFAQGRTTLPDARIVLPPESEVPSNYPAGTSLMQAPFVRLGGWDAAAWSSVAAVIAAVLITVRWIRETGGNPGFALLVLAFPGTLFFGRIAMSDAPSTAIVAAALWLAWPREGSRRRLFASGLAMGLTLLFREPNVLLVAPFAVAVVLERRARAWPLVAGGLLGVALRLLTSQWLHGNALYVRDAGYGFSIASVAHNLPVYALILLVFFPLGLFAPIGYRGSRRLECLAACGSYVALFLLYDYDSVRQNGTARGILLSTRFMLPLVPLLAVMSAEWWPRIWNRATPRIRARGPAFASVVAAALVPVAFATHAAVRRLEAEPVAIASSLQRYTRAEAPVITNHDATLKYLSPAYGPRRLILRRDLAATRVPALLEQYGALTLALLDRTDSEFFRADAAANERFVAELRQRCRLDERTVERFGNTLTLRVFDVSACR